MCTPRLRQTARCSSVASGRVKSIRQSACASAASTSALIATPQGLRAYGAGILSSAGELRHSITSKAPQRVAFDLQRLMRSRYRIDTFQATYFVIDSFQQLFDATAPDFTPVYGQVREQISLHAEIEAGTVLPGERRFSV